MKNKNINPSEYLGNVLKNWNAFCACHSKIKLAIEKILLENEKLKAEIERLKAIGKDEIEYRKALEKYSVSLAIKEFAAKVEQKCLDSGIYPACVKRAIEETKEEMTEKDDD